MRVAPYEGSAAEWDAFASAQPGSTICHRLAWRDLIQEVFGHECLYTAARTPDGALAGVLPLVRVRSALFGHYLVSMPFLNAGGPLGGEDAVRALGAAAAERARRDGVKLLELRSTHTLPLDLPVSHRKISVLLDLPADPESLFASFPSKLRSQVRRPGKEGVTVRLGPDQCDPFYDVFARHMRDLGTPVLPRAFFHAIRDRFGDAAWFGAAWHDGVPVAGGAGFRAGETFEMTWASSLTAWNRIAPNMLLYWEYMRAAIADGAAIFDFGRCTPDAGTHRFKRQWGGRDVPLWWYQATLSGAPAATPSPDAGAFALGPRLWRHLPLPLATFLGPRIVRYIP